MSKYYFTQDVSAGQYYPAGSTASTADVGGTLPIGFVPNPAAMQPLDAPAITAYYAARPPQEPIVKNQFMGVPVQLQSVYWQSQATANGTLWTLVGSGLPSIYF